MQAEIRRADPSKEFQAQENCFILEVSNDAGDPDISIARARVHPGMTTAWHRLEGIVERYPNVGDEDLVFFCICTPRFTQHAYVTGR